MEGMNFSLTTAILSIAAITLYSYFFLPKQLEFDGLGRFPKKFGPRSIFTILHILLLILIIFIVYFGTKPDYILSVLDGKMSLPDSVSELFQENTGAGPLTAEQILSSCAIFFALFGFKKWRSIEGFLLQQLQNISMLDEDIDCLTNALLESNFETSSYSNCKQVLAIDYLKSKVSVEDNHGINIHSLSERFLKTKFLLEMLNANKEIKSSLSSETQKNLHIALKSHRRKSDLILKVQSYIEKIERGELSILNLNEFLPMISSEISESETTERLSESKNTHKNLLNEFLISFINYLDEEYQETLSEWAHISSKSIIMTGDEAEKHIFYLKKAGFTELGEIQPIEFHRTIMISILALISTILIFHFVPGILSNYFGSPIPNGEFLILMVFSITLATVFGSIIGGLRRLAQSHNTRWGTYFFASTITSVIHIIVIFTAFNMGLSPPFESSQEESYHTLAYFIVTAILPFAIVLGICWLAQKKQIGKTPLTERAKDGFSLGAILAISGILFIILADFLNIPPPNKDMTTYLRMLVVSIICGSLGLVIGALIVFPVRRAAQSSILVKSES